MTFDEWWSSYTKPASIYTLKETTEDAWEAGVQEGIDRTKELIEALEEAVYFLEPTEEDMQEKTGVYRIVTALEKYRPEDVCKVDSYIWRVTESLLKEKKQ